jgi:hypothetical protein
MKKTVIDVQCYDFPDCLPPSADIIESSFAAEKQNIPVNASKFFNAPQNARLRRLVDRFKRHCNSEIINKVTAEDFDYEAKPDQDHCFIYVAMHIGMRELYIGQTTQSVTARIRQHFYGRRRKGGSELSSFFAWDGNLSDYVIFPIDCCHYDQRLFVECQYQHSFHDLQISLLPGSRTSDKTKNKRRHRHGYSNTKRPADETRQPFNGRSLPSFGHSIRFLNHLEGLSPKFIMHELSHASQKTLQRLALVLPSSSVNQLGFVSNAVKTLAGVYSAPQPPEERDELAVSKFHVLSSGLDPLIKKAWNKVGAFWPFDKQMNEVMFCAKTVPPISKFMFNYTAVSKQTVKAECSCHRFSHRTWSDSQGTTLLVHYWTS